MTASLAIWRCDNKFFFIAQPDTLVFALFGNMTMNNAEVFVYH